MRLDTILAIDQGTTNSKAVLLDHQGHIVSQGSASLAIDYPQPGWVEQSADDIWASVVQAISQCVTKTPSARILGIGISNQRESVLAWNSRTGKPITPVITWQCRRTSVQTERLKNQGYETEVLSRTGLPLDPLFPASKIHWLMDNASESTSCFGTVDSWLIWKLTGGQRYVTDRSNASRTQLLNVKSGEWDEDLCDLFDVDRHRLPEVTNTQHLFGHTRGVPDIDDGIPIASAIGDSHAALFGHAAFEAGEAKATFGTGSSVMMVSSVFKIPENGMTTTIAWSINDQITYALEGNILVSASLFPWAARLLGLNGDVDELMRLAETVVNSGGVTLVPAMVGLGAPHWNPEARGLLTGLSFSSDPAHIAHAAALSMPLQVVDVLQAMSKQSDAAAGVLYVDGGPTRNKFLMQMLANLLNQPIQVSKDPELSAMGAGMLAGLEVGFWSGLDEIAALAHERVTIHPNMTSSTRSKVLSEWKNAVRQCQIAVGESLE